MSPLNLQVMVNANSTPSNRLAEEYAAINASKYKGRMVEFVGLDLRNVGPGSGQKIAAQLEADVKAGAMGVGEIMKSFGLTIKSKADGTRLKLDDPELDPVWEKAADLNIPVFIHTGDPAEFFQPIDFNNERWLELALYRDRRYQDRSRFPSFEDLMGERDRLFARHPRTIWVLAHFGWHANDLARLGKMFDQRCARNLSQVARPGRRALRHRAAAAHRPSDTFFVEVPFCGPDPVRQGQLPA